MKRITTLILVVALLISVISIINFVGDRLLPGTREAIAAEPVLSVDALSFASHTSSTITPHFPDQIFSDDTLIPRDGYILAPSMFGATGIDVSSSFFLRTPYDIQPNEPAPILSIDGQPQPIITREDANTFLVTPAIPLSNNSLYIFRLTRDNHPDITWAFQTTIRFEIMSTLPRNQATNVPIRTGIEVDFSIDAHTNIVNYFSVYPHIEGRFIYRDTTAIFMPTSPLNYQQIYTVTIRAGIGLPGTNETLTADHMFSFETAAPAEIQNRPVTISFPDRYVEFPSFEAPSISFRLNYNPVTTTRPIINIDLYRIDNHTQGIAAVNRLVGTPSWSRRVETDRLVDTSNLAKVLSFYITERQDSVRSNEIFTLPDNLSPGFYVVNATVDNSRNQMIIQITDLAVQIIADNSKAILWINDMTTGMPVAGARVFDPRDNRTYEANAYGITIIERMLSDNNNNNEHLVITTSNHKESVVFTPQSPWLRTPSANDKYWTALQLDRTLFQRDDTLSFWGFVQNRQQDENITYVTAVLTESRWWHYGTGDTLHRQTVQVMNGTYSGEIRLPHLDPGSYELAIFHGNIILNSIFFSVMDYVTPPYRLVISTDRQAVFAGEDVTFIARTEFFEGTPVPELDISYRFSSWNLRTSGDGQAQTNLEGIIKATSITAVSSNTAQGQTNLSFSAEATLPEIGEIHKSASVRVFINDIDVQAQATRTEENASLSINVNSITLDRLNDGTARHHRDFLDAPVAEQAISVEIFRIYWERQRDGEFYDHVTRQVVPRYRYVRQEQSLEQFELTTDINGEAVRYFQVPNQKNESYEARLTIIDGNGRTITRNVFIGRDFTSFHQNASNDRPFLHNARSASAGYDIGDEVNLTIMRGNEAVSTGNFLFVVMQNGILSYHVGSNSLAFTFAEEHVPNVTVHAYHFNGHTYHTNSRMRQHLHFNRESRNLILNVTTCQDIYRPGDTSTITITTTDLDGNPKAANVNISIVDEALFALRDYTVNTLASLYRWVSDGLRFNLSTHRTFMSDGIDGDVAAAIAPMFMTGSSDEDIYIRERFEDTAIFASLRTNEQGIATLTFQLPDNITSWRMTASGISEDLYAGNTVQNIIVTSPMFLHYSLNDIFLVGDIPAIGVNAYGTSFSGGEKITFEVWRENAPNDIRRTIGTSFERINIPLWEMTEEGTHTLIIKATTENGLSDIVRHSYQVIASHRQVDTAFFYDVTPNTIFDIGSQGLTNIIFTNHGHGQFLKDLLSMRHTRGARIEGLIARREATKLIEQHFPGTPIFSSVADSFDPREYQRPNGGIAILPYGGADLQATVMLMPFILDDINVNTLRSYLYNIYRSESADNKMLALYGLAMLGEPVLLNLHNYATLEELSVKNIAYVALGFAALGETQTAIALYKERIAPHIQRIAPYYRIYTGDGRRDILEATSIVALLAAQLEMPERFGLHNYATRHHTFNPLMHIERLAFISHEIENTTNVAASITYSLFGEEITRNLSHRQPFILRIPAQNMHEFKLVSVTGDVGAVSIIRTPLENIEPVENDIVINRKFFRAGTQESTNTFEQGELVRVQITVDYSARALYGSYVITDFLPAGLVHTSIPARFGPTGSSAGRWRHARTEGQRIMFFDYNGKFDNVHIYYYYARVINPGTFKAEGPLVQSVGAREYLAIGEDTILTIQIPD